jgi:hypothetical protein
MQIEHDDEEIGRTFLRREKQFEKFRIHSRSHCRTVLWAMQRTDALPFDVSLLFNRASSATGSARVLCFTMAGQSFKKTLRPTLRQLHNGRASGTPRMESLRKTGGFMQNEPLLAPGFMAALIASRWHIPYTAVI